MITLTLRDGCCHPLRFYLDMEELAARHFDEECFFTWIVRPTVIYGRNQVEGNEVDSDFCRRHGIEIVQRKSGGGCVYADEGNMMMSYITPTKGDTVSEIFERYLEKVAAAVRRIVGFCGDDGIEGGGVVTTSNNDVLLNGRKVSGNALYLTKDRGHAIVHGTLLHSCDVDVMVRAITPSAEKLSSKGVASVRQRVMNLNEVTDMGIDEVRRIVEEEFGR